MEHFFLARQAIYDRALNVFAYELLFRNGNEQSAKFTDGNSATSQVILNAFLDMGLDKIVGDKRAFINLTHDLLIHEDTRQLPNDQVVLEILEDVTPSEEVINAMRQLADDGFCVALDDFFHNESLQPMVELADIIKIDILNLTAHQIKDQVECLKGEGRKLLAEKVETMDQYQLCRSLGFDFFQGYFVAHPHIIEGRRPPANRLATLQLVTKLQNPEVELNEIEALISTDLSLSYRVLKTINSSMYNLPSKVESIRTAVQFLGLRQLKHLVTLIALANFDDKPNELIKLALIRAKFSEEISDALNSAYQDVSFTAGMFSMLEPLLDFPMAEIVKELPLSDELIAALLNHEGDVGKVLQMVKNYEKGEWDQLKLPEGTDIGSLYLSAVEWTDQSIEHLQA